MKPFNLVTIAPVSYAHTGALWELKTYIHYMLLECGFDVSETTNSFNDGCYNIFFGSHLIGSTAVAYQIPSYSIIFNTEQLEPNKVGALWSPSKNSGSAYSSLLARCTVWDYSRLNLPAIPHDRKSLIPLLYCRKVASPLKRVHGKILLFYGSLSPSREQTIRELTDTGIEVETLFGVYGRERDEKMMRSWAVLNLHRDIPYIENRHQFEAVRCFYPLTCGVPVISDTSRDPTAHESYKEMIWFFERESMVSQLRFLYMDYCAAPTRADSTFGYHTDEMLDKFKYTSASKEIIAAVMQFLQSLT